MLVPARTPGGEERHMPSAMLRRIQQTPRPWTGSLVVIFGSVEIGQLAIGPVVEPCAFGSFASRQGRFHNEGRARARFPTPSRQSAVVCARIGNRVVARHAKHIALAGAPQRLFRSRQRR